MIEGVTSAGRFAAAIALCLLMSCRPENGAMVAEPGGAKIADSLAASPNGPDDSGSVGPSGVEAEISSDDLPAARSVLEEYYRLIARKEYEQAYALWSDSGRASGQTLEEFRAGYTATADVRIEVGEGRVEGAAGSRYAEFSSEVIATTASGGMERFRGGYVLRRSVVDGASDEQRSWRIYSAELKRID